MMSGQSHRTPHFFAEICRILPDVFRHIYLLMDSCCLQSASQSRSLQLHRQPV